MRSKATVTVNRERGSVCLFWSGCYANKRDAIISVSSLFSRKTSRLHLENNANKIILYFISWKIRNWLIYRTHIWVDKNIVQLFSMWIYKSGTIGINRLYDCTPSMYSWRLSVHISPIYLKSNFENIWKTSLLKVKRYISLWHSCEDCI